MATDIVKYEAGGKEVQLDAMTVRKYLVTGGNPSDQEVKLFIELCKNMELNPFLREAYLTKFGNQPAQIITGKDAFTKRADSNPDYKGKQAGIIVVNLKKNIEYREGSFYLKGREELVGGWAKIFKAGKEPELSTVSLDEYVGKKKDGSINSMWSTKPATMIRKVAVVQALREAFPNTLSQLYIEEEMGLEHELPTNNINPEEERFNEFHVDEPDKPATKIEKQQVMQLAAEKGLMTGSGRDADISKLNELAGKHNINLRGMTSSQANNLIFILNDYEEEQQEVVDVPDEDINPVEDNSSESAQESQEEDNVEEDTSVQSEEENSLDEGCDPF